MNNHQLKKARNLKDLINIDVCAIDKEIAIEKQNNYPQGVIN